MPLIPIKPPKKPDLQLQRNVRTELAWEPRIDPADIGVTVEDGVVTLSGHVRSGLDSPQ